MCDADAQRVLELLKRDASQGDDTYQTLLNRDDNDQVIDASYTGLARELARINLPVGIYTQWYWKIDLHNLFHFLSLRADSHAQYEIQAYANIMLDVVKEWVPHAYEAFMDYRKGSVNLSAQGWEIVKRRMKGETVTQETSGLSPREWRELVAVLESD